MDARLDVTRHLELEVLAIRAVAVVAMRTVAHVGSRDVKVRAAICGEAHLARATEVVTDATDIEVGDCTGLPSRGRGAIGSACLYISTCSTRQC